MESMRESIGELYEGIKINTNYTLIYTFLFVLRRFIYLTIETFMQDKKQGGVQIIMILYLNLFTMIYIGSAKAFQKNIHNKIEVVNEYLV
jgi:hypothetical protein